MNRILLAFFFCCLAISALSQKKAAPDKRFAGLDTLIPGILRDWHAAGCAVAVIEKNKVVYLKGFGYKDYDKKQPVTENTLFAIGSCSKAFTTTIIGQLVQDGKLDLDKPVTDYLPELKFYNEYLNAHVTLRDMMTHRTGLPRHDYAWYGSPSPRDSLLYRIRFLEPSAELRQSWQYNNFMYLAQGMLAEKLTGKKWETLVAENIFKPLGMSTANFSVDSMQKAADYSYGYYEDNDTVKKLDYMNINAMGPAGSINANVKEMANWATAWVNDGRFNGKEVIPASFRSQAISAQMSMGGGAPGKDIPDVFFASYGFGWMLESYRSHYLVEHGGNIDGFSANVAFYPADSISIVVLSNQNNSAVPGLVRNTLSDRMLSLPTRNWSRIRLDATAKSKPAPSSVTNIDSINRKPNTKPSHPTADYTGVYEHPGYGKVVVTIENDSLILNYNKSENKLYLNHYHYDVFVLKERGDSSFSGPKIRFTTNEKGDIESLGSDLEPSVKTIVFNKLGKTTEVTKTDLEKYTGEYLLDKVVVKVYVRGEKTLMVLVPGQPDYELVPAGKDEFNLKVAKGYSVKFDTDSSQKVTALSFIQPNGIFKATKK